MTAPTPIFGFALAGMLLLAPQDADDVRERLAKIDKTFLRELTALAKHWDGEKDPEAAHFFAECAAGLVADQGVVVVSDPDEADAEGVRGRWSSAGLDTLGLVVARHEDGRRLAGGPLAPACKGQQDRPRHSAFPL